MPDPLKDLAPIIEPLAPPAPAGEPGYFLAMGLALAGIVIVALAAGWWRMRQPLRALGQLTALAESGEGEARDLADRLAALLPHFRRAPDPAWLDAMQRLRFGPPREDAQAVIARLCREAAMMLRSSGSVDRSEIV